MEFQAGGTSPDDAKQLCIKLEEARVDFVDLSGGTFEGRAFEHKKESTVRLSYIPSSLQRSAHTFLEGS